MAFCHPGGSANTSPQHHQKGAPFAFCVLLREVIYRPFPCHQFHTINSAIRSHDDEETSHSAHSLVDSTTVVAIVFSSSARHGAPLFFLSC
uniref:Uncharacterized protein n=1 Tax=Anopheles atroparvus TaxID=41427 RepID=A0AAG5DEK5_ANOAO